VAYVAFVLFAVAGIALLLTHAWWLIWVTALAALWMVETA
jgi:hypothetical protein